MIKTLAKSIREYKLPSILTLIFIMGEVLIEVSIPFLVRDMINNFENLNGTTTINDVFRTGLMLVGMALISLCCGGIAALTCAKASAGFAKNLQHRQILDGKYCNKTYNRCYQCSNVLYDDYQNCR